MIGAVHGGLRTLALCVGSIGFVVSLLYAIVVVMLGVTALPWTFGTAALLAVVFGMVVLSTATICAALFASRTLSSLVCGAAFLIYAFGFSSLASYV